MCVSFYYEPCRDAIVEALDQPRVVAISMLDIYKVFAILYVICIGKWIHHQVTTDTFVVSLHCGKSAEILDHGKA
jgi:hypothetical protein